MRKTKKFLAAVVALAISIPMAGVVAPATAAAAPVGQGFNLNASDLRFILKQIKIAEQHSDTLTATNPCGTMRGTGADQIPAGEVGDTLPWGLRLSTAPATTSSPARSRSAPPTRTSRAWCRRASQRRGRRPDGPGPAPATPSSSYTQTSGTVFDSQPRVISNLIVDQTADNPAAVDAAGEVPEVDAVRCVLHPERGARRRPVGAVQLLVHAVRPVLRPRPRPGQQGRQRHGLHAAEAGRPAVRAGLADELHGPHPGDPRRRPRGEQPDLAVGRPEPDLHLPPVAPGLPARVRHWTRPATRRPPAGSSPGPATAWRPGPTSRRRPRPARHRAHATPTRSASRCSPPTPTAASSAGPNGFPQLSSPARRRCVEGNPAANGGTGVTIRRRRASRTGHAFLDDIAHNAVPKAGSTPDGDTVVTPASSCASSPASRRAASTSTTTRCSTRTSSPVTAASTRTSA